MMLKMLMTRMFRMFRTEPVLRALFVPSALFIVAGCGEKGASAYLAPPESASIVLLDEWEVIKPGTSLSTSKIKRFDVIRPPFPTFSVVFGPAPDAAPDAVATVTLELENLPGQPAGNFYPFVNVNNGFALLWGPWPLARTTTVRAGSFGTTYLVQELNGVSRVVLLNTTTGTDKIKVWREDETDEAKNTTWQIDEQYIEYAGSGAIPPAAAVPTDPMNEVRKIVEYAKVVGKVAGAELP